MDAFSDTAIRKRAKANGWTRDLSGAVRSRVRESLVREVRANLLAWVSVSVFEEKARALAGPTKGAEVYVEDRLSLNARTGKDGQQRNPRNVSEVGTAHYWGKTVPDARLLEALGRSELFGAWLPKAYGTAVAYTAQGSRQNIADLLGLYQKFLNRVGRSGRLQYQRGAHRKMVDEPSRYCSATCGSCNVSKSDFVKKGPAGFLLFQAGSSCLAMRVRSGGMRRWRRDTVWSWSKRSGRPRRNSTSRPRQRW